jgi:hypothetical protein
MGCQEPSLHICISLVDLVAISLISGRRPTELLREDVKIGFDPIHEKEPWIGRVLLELRKPCHFLYGKECSIYPGRPIACALFPEYRFIVERPETILQKDIFRNFPCIQKPCSISPQRKATLQQLSEMSAKDVFLSDFYLFGTSPFVIDLKSIAGEGLEGIPVSKNGKATLSHHRMEELISQKLREGGYLDHWEVRVKKLNQVNGLDDLARMKSWTDQMAMVSDKFLSRVAYQFDGNRLLPVHLRK